MNKGELVNLIKEYLENEEASFVANIDQFVRLAEEDIYRKVQLPDLRQISTANTTPDVRFLETPLDYLSTYSMTVLDGDDHYPILNKELSFLREAYPSTATRGRPRYYALYNDTSFTLAPIPDDVYQIEMNYFFRPQSIMDEPDDDDTTWLSVNAENALLFGALFHGYVYMKGDQDVIAAYQKSYAESIDALKLLTEGRNRKDSYRTSDSRIQV